MRINSVFFIGFPERKRRDRGREGSPRFVSRYFFRPSFCCRVSATFSLPPNRTLAVSLSLYIYISSRQRSDGKKPSIYHPKLRLFLVPGMIWISHKLDASFSFIFWWKSMFLYHLRLVLDMGSSSIGILDFGFCLFDFADFFVFWDSSLLQLRILSIAETSICCMWVFSESRFWHTHCTFSAIRPSIWVFFFYSFYISFL